VRYLLLQQIAMPAGKAAMLLRHRDSLHRSDMSQTDMSRELQQDSDTYSSRYFLKRYLPSLVPCRYFIPTGRYMVTSVGMSVEIPFLTYPFIRSLTEDTCI
jgi:hypothetical protein